jgi:hypothetical protein
MPQKAGRQRVSRYCGFLPRLLSSVPVPNAPRGVSALFLSHCTLLKSDTSGGGGVKGAKRPAASGKTKGGASCAPLPISKGGGGGGTLRLNKKAEGVCCPAGLRKAILIYKMPDGVPPHITLFTVEY